MDTRKETIIIPNPIPVRTKPKQNGLSFISNLLSFSLIFAVNWKLEHFCILSILNNSVKKLSELFRVYNKNINCSITKRLTSGHRAESCPGTNSSKTQVLTDCQFHIKQRDPIDCKHHKVWYQESCCQINTKNFF